MAQIQFNVEGMYCYECSRALRSFLGGLKGINKVEAEGGKVYIDYDENKIDHNEVKKIVRETVNRLGYKLTD
ncbi:MAG: heavy-metal-associated domain-containing protein [Nitrospirae bacterium]|nr:heavy-metal-associated domain-containing protein [Nitrospirota bacterium]